jgi:hypothetical protein
MCISTSITPSSLIRDMKRQNGIDKTTQLPRSRIKFFVTPSSMGRQGSNLPLRGKTKFFTAFALLSIVAFSATSMDQRTMAQQRQDVNWEQLCIQYGELVGIHTPCSELAHGTFLTPHGKTALACLFGGGTLLLLGVDPTTVAMIGKAARGACP